MVRDAIRAVLRRCGFDVVRYTPGMDPRRPPDFEARHWRIIEAVRPYTMTSPERLYALIEAVRHVLVNRIPGAFVECGVYKGGSVMAMALATLAEQADPRDLYLFDTFAGMPAPGDLDVNLGGVPASETFERKRLSETSSTWARASIDEVKAAMARTGYPSERIHFVPGLVEETIPGRAPEAIALLRLDTDWYRSTRHELEHLHPRVSRGGVIIIDDYGHFKGARQAVDEFFRERGMAPFLHRIDYTARLFLKD